jgi:predicted CopG family antitoxin
MSNFKLKMMKKLLGIVLIVMLSTVLNAQRSIDDLFRKYSGKEGFTTVDINGDLLKLASGKNQGNGDMPKEITRVRILSQDKESDVKIDNFYDLVTKDIDLKDYEEFMNITQADEKVRMLVKADGNKFSEFLLIVAGKEGKDNAIIQIKGSMSLDEAKKFAEENK